MRRARFAGRDAAVGTVQLHVPIGIGHRNTNLINRPLRQEHRKGRDPRGVSHRAHTGGGTHRVLLGNPHLIEPIRIRISKHRSLRTDTDIAVENDHFRVGLTHLNQCFSKRNARSYFVTYFHNSTFSFSSFLKT